MFTIKKLLELDQEGFFPAPGEDENSFYSRVCAVKEFISDPKKYFSDLGEKPLFSFKTPIPIYEWEWSKEFLSELYGVYPKKLVGFFSSKNLQILHGAQTWIFDAPETLAIIQVHPKLQKKSYYRFYPLSEVLAHEMIHALRAKFASTKFEEIFAYSTSTKMIRKVFGPLILKPLEFWIAILLAIFAILNPLGITLFSFWIFCGLYRLFRLHRILNLCLQKLGKWTSSQKNARAFLFRLSDEEIETFSKFSLEEFKEYCLQKKDFRWDMLKKAYLSNIFHEKIDI